MKKKILAVFTAFAIIISAISPINRASARLTTADFEWTLNPGGAGVTRAGQDGHVLRLDIAADSDEARQVLETSVGATLDITYAEGKTAGSARRIFAWTNLLGGDDISFASKNNGSNRVVAWTDPRLESSRNSARLNIPPALLRNSVTGATATSVYIVITTDSGETQSLSSQRGGGNSNEFANLATARLSVTGNAPDREPRPFDPDARFVINNPYEEVDWATFRQYKAGQHSHTLNSDGADGVTATARRAYELGYHIWSFNDHSVTNIYPDRSPLSGNGDTMSAELIADMRAGVGRGGDGMIFVPGTNEHSGIRFEEIAQRPTSHHFNTYWSFLPPRSADIYTLTDRVNEERQGGLIMVNHAGRYTGGQMRALDGFGTNDWNESAMISNTPSNFKPYADLFEYSHSIFALEIINKFDSETQSDRVLWDNILTEIMPNGVPAWGMASDDSHFNFAIGYAYNLMLMPELSLHELRRCMNNGAFFAFSRVDRQYGIFAGQIDSWHWAPLDLGSSARESVLALPVPEITSVTVGENSITIAATGHEFVDWWADGVKIHTGATLDLVEHQQSINSYVRATVGHSQYGVLYVQPFEIQRVGEERALPNLVSVEELRIQLPIGAAPEELMIHLPSAVRITTDKCTPGNPRFADIEWDFSGYDDRSPTYGLSGIVRLPAGIKRVNNPNNVPLNVRFTVELVVQAVEKKINISQFGDSYYYHSRTDSEFLSEAFDMSVTDGWTLAQTSIGFGDRGHVSRLPQASPNHTYTYFKKSFTVAADFDPSQILSVSGRHNIDDTLIIYINGTEVYRFNTVPKDSTAAEGAGIGEPLDWAAYSGVGINPSVVAFDINSDYNATRITVRGDDRVYHSASLTNLRAALRAGENVITAVVGQNSETSSDLLFDLELSVNYSCAHNNVTPVEGYEPTTATCDDPATLMAVCGDCGAVVLKVLAPAHGRCETCDRCRVCEPCDCTPVSSTPATSGSTPAPPTSPTPPGSTEIPTSGNTPGTTDTSDTSGTTDTSGGTPSTSGGTPSTSGGTPSTSGGTSSSGGTPATTGSTPPRVPELFGDADGNGEVNIGDSLELLKFVIGVQTGLNALDRATLLAVADIDGDGEVTINDALALLLMVIA